MRILFEVGFYKFLTNPIETKSVGDVANFLASCVEVNVRNRDNNTICEKTENGHRLKMDLMPDDCVKETDIEALLRESRNDYSALLAEHNKAKQLISKLESDISMITMMTKKAS